MEMIKTGDADLNLYQTKLYQTGIRSKLKCDLDLPAQIGLSPVGCAQKIPKHRLVLALIVERLSVKVL